MRDYDGKTAEERMHERRERLLEAGLDLFATEGFAGASIRAVLRRSGLQDRYFSESFPSLDALLAAILDRIYDEEFAAFTASDPVGGTGVKRWRVLLEAVTRILEDDPRKARVKFIEAVGAGPASTTSRRDGLRRHAEIVGTLMPPVAPERDVDVSLVVAGLVAGVDELLLYWIAGAVPVTREQVIDHSTLLFEAVSKEIGRPSAEFRR